MSDHYLSLSLQPKDLPPVTQPDDHSIEAGGWQFDFRDGPPTWDDVLAFAAAVRWFEQHPEVVPDGD